MHTPLQQILIGPHCRMQKAVLGELHCRHRCSPLTLKGPLIFDLR